MPGFENLFVIRALVAPCYLEPSFTSSKVTEAVSGETVEIIDLNGDWLFIKQDDGYESWINFFYGTIQKAPFLSDHMAVELSSIPFGTRLIFKNNRYFTVNGAEYKFKDKSPVKLDEPPKPSNIIINARKLTGCTYRWGGKTSLGFDCSGFVQTIYLSAGILLPRDSWQQSNFFIDKKIEGNLSKPGDLHFFGEKGKISHVGISTGGLSLIHCQGWVKEETFSEHEKIYNNRLADMYMHTCSVELNLNT